MASEKYPTSGYLVSASTCLELKERVLPTRSEAAAYARHLSALGWNVSPIAPLRKPEEPTFADGKDEFGNEVKRGR